MDWSGVDYLWIIVMFLSAVWTLILTAPIHCRGSIGEQVMKCYISPNLMKKHGLRVRIYSVNVPFWVNYSFNMHSCIVLAVKTSRNQVGNYKHVNSSILTIYFKLIAVAVPCWEKTSQENWLQMKTPTTMLLAAMHICVALWIAV